MLEEKGVKNEEILAIGMLGIFLLAVAAVQPVTASHQKGITGKFSALRDFIGKIAPPQPSCIGFLEACIILIFMGIVSIWAIIQILLGNVPNIPGT